MQFEQRFAVLLGRIIDLLQRSPDAVDDHKAALRSLVTLSADRSVTVRLRYESTVTVEGMAIPPETPFVSLVAQQMRAHGIAIVFVAQKASPLDLLTLLYAMAQAPSAPRSPEAVEGALREGNVITIGLVTGERARKGRGSVPALRVTDALRVAGVLDELEYPVASPPPVRAEADEVFQEVVGLRSLEPDSLSPVPPGPSVAPPELLARHPGVHPKSERSPAAGPTPKRVSEEERQLMARLNAIVRQVTAGMGDGKVLESFETTAALLQESERRASDEDARRAYAIALQRVLTPENLQRFAGLMTDELYAADVVKVMRYAGPKGTQALMDKLVEAATFAERRAYLQALRGVESGVEIIISMFSHHEWFVVRNVADLVGDLGVEEAVPALGRVAGHPDARVRRSVGVALAKIGTAAAATPLRALLRDRDPEVRLAVAQAVAGRGLDALVMPLVTASEEEEDEQILAEYYRGMGRIGTAQAVQVLAKVARSSGSLFKRRPARLRLAAIEGLAAAGSPAARTALGELANDKDKQVREAAHAALARAAAEPPSEA